MILENEKIFNEYFRGKKLSKKQRDFFLNVLRNTKEITDSFIEPSGFELENVVITKENVLGTKVSFQCIIQSENESRYMIGSISRVGKNIDVDNVEVIRLKELNVEDKYFSYDETFIAKNDGYERVSMLKGNNGYIIHDDIPYFDKDETKLYKEEQVKKLSKRFEGIR